jgi:NADH-quinone oxidoreductase subunit N
MYALAIIGLLSTVISAFYYLKIIKIIYFDKIEKQLDPIKDKRITGTIFISCIFLLTFFLYPSLINNLVNSIF